MFSKTRRRLSVVGAASVVVAVFHVTLLQAEFKPIDEIHVDALAHGIAFDGSVWHINVPVTAPGGWTNYDESFALIDAVTVSGTSDTRGLTYDPNAGTLFLTDQVDNLVLECALDGTVIQSFATPHTVANAIAYDENESNLWVAHYSGWVTQVDTDGSFIGEFDTGMDLTGVAFDRVNDTLLLLHSLDTIYEYAKNGALIGHVYAIDEITGNGQNLAYDPQTGMLYATSYSGYVTVFFDPARPVEGSLFYDGFEDGDLFAWSNAVP